MVNVEEYFNNFFKGTKDATLNTMKYFMNEYNNIQNKMKIIHIAGTNGKGSCVQMISNILLKQGYKVGKFMSPHLIRYNERICINNDAISDEELSDLIEELEPKIRKYNKEHEFKVTFFELITIIALIYFYRKNVDFVILETGLGGTYDCTNIISNSLVSLITSIGYDHMRILGNTLQEIAYNKAGIIKENSNTVFFEQSEEINNVFIKTCRIQNNKLHLINEQKIQKYNYDNKYQYFDYEDYKNIQLVLKGKKQVQNAVLCIECMNILNNLGYTVSEESIREGLKTVIHKARMDILNEKPLIIFDGAHNELAIENLRNTIDMYYKDYKRIYIVSILKRKDYEKMLQLLLKDEEAEIIFTSGNDESKYILSEELYNIARKYSDNKKMYIKDLDEAIEYVIKENKTNTVNFVIGSFYTYGNILDKINLLTNTEKMGLFILIICCLFNVVSKLVKRTPLKEELIQTAEYILNQEK